MKGANGAPEEGPTMSITFVLANRLDNGDIVPACMVNHYAAPCVAVGAEAAEHAEDRAHYNMCDCSEVARDECGICSLSLNVANGNAALILERLGVEFDYYGEIDGADLVGRAMVGNVGRDDSGVASSEDRREGLATVIDCGVRPGYFEDRLGVLAELGLAAAERGCLVSWA